MEHEQSTQHSGRCPPDIAKGGLPRALLVKALSLAVGNSSHPSPALEKSTDDCTHSLLLNKDFGNYLSYAKHFVYHF